MAFDIGRLNTSEKILGSKKSPTPLSGIEPKMGEILFKNRPDVVLAWIQIRRPGLKACLALDKVKLGKTKFK